MKQLIPVLALRVMASMTASAMSVGTAITGLLLYMFTNENLRFYGMLMAMGTSSPKLVMMVCAQGIVAGLCGYGLGVGTSAIMGRVMAATGLPYAMVWQSLVITAAFVLVVCVLASLMSVRQALKTEPGIVFRT
jgi:putative ABC transport system permease protein